MAEQTDLRTGIKYGYQQGDGGWGDAMNVNLQTIAQVGTHPRLTGAATSTPPSSPSDGDMYIVGASPTGAWQGYSENDLAIYSYAATTYTALGWRNVSPETGWLVSDGTNLLHYTGTSWATIGAGGGGGLSAVSSDATLTGTGTATDILRVANPFTDADETKLDGIATGAEVNVNANWDATSGDAQILNKPTLGPQAPATSGQANKYLGVNATATALEYKDAPSGGGGSNYKGTWTTATSYAAGDIVVRLTKLYISRAAHTSAASTTPGLLTSSTWRTRWRELTTPDLGLITDSFASASDVADNDEIAVADVSTTTDETKRLTIANLKTKLGVTSGGGDSNYKGSWSAGESYSIGDIVKLGNPFYICETAHTSSNANAPFAQANWRTWWYRLGEPDVAALVNSLGSTQIATNDRVAIQDVSTTNDETKYATISALIDQAGPKAPATAGNANKFLGVNATATALEYKDAPSGGNGGGLSSVTSDTTLTGSGTSGDPLKVANPFTAADETKLDGIATGATRVTSIRTDATISGNGISTNLSVANPFTDADERKLDGIAAGAEVNVQANWTATSGDAFIRNKPTLGPQAPSTSGNANKFLGVNSSATALEYKDAPTGGGTTGLTSVSSDTTLTGSGTSGDPLKVANPFVRDWKGLWQTGTAYVVGNMVMRSTEYYICSTAHTSSATNAPGTATGRDEWHSLNIDIDAITSLAAGSPSPSDKIAIADVSSTGRGTFTTTVNGVLLLGQADWNETTLTDPSYIKNKPTSIGLTSVTSDATLTGSGTSTDPLKVANPFTAADETKLDGIAAGAEVNVQSDWNSNTGDSFIRNKPTIPPAITSIRTDSTISGNGISTDLSVAVPIPAIGGQGGKRLAVNPAGTQIIFVNPSGLPDVTPTVEQLDVIMVGSFSTNWTGKQTIFGNAERGATIEGNTGLYYRVESDLVRINRVSTPSKTSFTAANTAVTGYGMALLYINGNNQGQWWFPEAGEASEQTAVHGGNFANNITPTISNYGFVGSPMSALVFGGSNGNTRYNNFYRITPRLSSVGGLAGFTDTALTRAGATISVRENMGMVGDSTTGIIYGGENGSTILNDWYSYSVSGNTITLTALTAVGTGLQSRSRHSMLGTATEGIVFGGYGSGGTTLGGLYRYSVSGGTVTLSTIGFSGSLTARYWAGMAGDPNGTVLIYGGSAGRSDFYRLTLG